MRQLYKKIAVDKVTWLALNALWIVPVWWVSASPFISAGPFKELVVRFFEHQDFSFTTFSVLGFLVAFYLPPVLIGLLFVLNEGIQLLVSSVRVSWLLFTKAYREEPVAVLDIHYASRSWFSGKTRLEGVLFAGAVPLSSESPEFLDALIHDDLLPNSISRNWYETPHTFKDSNRFNIPAFIYTFHIFIFFLAIFSFSFIEVGIRQTLAWPLGVVVSFVMVVTFSLSMWSLRTRRHVKYDSLLDRNSGQRSLRGVVTSIRYNRQYAKLISQTWHKTEKSRSIDSQAEDYALIESSIDYRGFVGPKLGVVYNHAFSIWRIGSRVYWANRLSGPCAYDCDVAPFDRIPFTISQRDEVHQLPPSGVYDFEFKSGERLEENLIRGIARLRVHSNPEVGMLILAYKNQESASVDKFVLPSYNIGSHFELARDQWIPQGVFPTKMAMLDTNSFCYFMRFADCYWWECKQIEVIDEHNSIRDGAVSREYTYLFSFHILQKFSWDRDSRIERLDWDQSYEWDCSKPEFYFDQIEVDLWENAD